MNLLSLLLKSLLADSSISALAKKTGLNASSLKKLIPLAIPLLLKFLTKNASNESGALSLLGALSQHTNQKTLSDQIDEADTEDGGKIINHIFGSESEDVTNQLALESGMSQRDVNSALAGIAPALMSGLSAATNSVSSAPKVDLSDGLDLSDLMGMFVGTQQAQSQPSGGGLLSGLLGGNNAGLGGLFGSLFGSSAPQASQENDFNGTQLLSLLSSMRR
ncbi:MAG: DUF937 domain-containing protein [Oscillospiraceae bacterium]|nr:DUF937 domain-containing protein [Oscillospiraceae bacterium]